MTRAGFKKGAKIERWEAALKNPKKALTQIGALMVSESQRAFRAQKFGKDVWQERAVPNIYGIISDFHRGVSNPPKRRFEPRPALTDTGRLSKSIAFKVADLYLAEPPDRLAEYEGAFYSEELGTTYRLAVKEGRLVAQHRRYEDIPLTPSGPDAFSSDTWFFRNLKFTRAGGRVTEFSVTNNRARNLRFVKL